MDELKTFGKYAVDLVLLSFCFVVGKGEMEVFDGVLGVGGGSRKPKKERKGMTCFIGKLIQVS